MTPNSLVAPAGRVAPRVSRWKALGARLVFLLTASYGLLYFSYKFLIPWSGTNDFQHYYWMYRTPLNFHVAPSPFVLRQVSAMLTYLVWKAHIYYPNEIWFVDSRYDQHVFFAALFTNWVCLVLAALTAGVLSEEMLGRRSFLCATMAGLICLLSFHSQFVVISGITEGVSWLMLSLAFLAYLRRIEWAVVVLLILAILQREALLVAMGCIAALDLFRGRAGDREFRYRVMLYAAAGFAVYLAFRRMVPGNDHQIHAVSMLASLRRVRVTRAMVFESFLNQNVVMIAVAAGVLQRRREGAILFRHRWLPIFLVTFGCLEFLALCAGLDVDIGRIAGITIPLFAASAAADLMRLESSGGLASPTGFEPVLPPGTGGVLGH